ncbi:MAG TPA: hypothetical protein DDZ80_10900 [Cyanobacteria bacterium UBA8803]|nr:hypothetical protein [Cyanobacteria bacterium UBA9273]HBL59000.1 hypothetical protein [Cyanobacteria bacterium UBA8803]
MRTLATKQPTPESAKQNQNGEKVRSACSSASLSRSVSPLSTGMPLLQRQCACGGGCPRCQEKLGIQTKLKIGEPGDQYEQEADRVADEVMRMPEPSVQRQIEPEEEEEEEIVYTKAISSPISPVSKGQDEGEVPLIVAAVLRSQGRPLNQDTRTSPVNSGQPSRGNCDMRSLTQTKTTPKPSFTPVQTGLLQRKCACGNSASLTGKCTECENKRLTLQRRSTNQAEPDEVPPIVHEVLRSPSQKIQPKLKISQPNDYFEQEADWIADKIMRMPSPDITVNGSAAMRFKPLANTELVQLQELEKQEETIQPKHTSNKVHEVTPDLEAGIENLHQSSGEPLPSEIRTFMEPRFGRDFSEIRLHTSVQASQLARRLNARAFTIGKDIVFGSGEFQLKSYAGRQLLAHELAHTLQQNSRDRVVTRVVENNSSKSETPCVGSKARELENAIRIAKSRMKEAKPLIDSLGSEVSNPDSMASVEQAFEELFAPLDPTNSQPLKDVKSNINAMEEKLGNLKVNNDLTSCLPKNDEVCGDATIAFVEPSSDVINFCQLFFKIGSEEKVITVLHEVAHTFLSDEPDVYTHDRLFSLLTGFASRPAVNNPDSLAIFVSVTAKKISLKTELSKLEKPPKDKLVKFSPDEEQFVQKSLALAEVTIDSTTKKLRSAIAEVKSKQGNKPSSFSLETKLVLGRLSLSGLLSTIKFEKIMDDSQVKTVREKVLSERTATGKLTIMAVRDAMDSITQELQKGITITRSSGKRSPGIVAGAGASSVEIFDDFFPQILQFGSGFSVISSQVIIPQINIVNAAPAAGTETPEQLKGTVELWLEQIVMAVQVKDLGEQKQSQLSRFLKSFAETKP